MDNYIFVYKENLRTQMGRIWENRLVEYKSFTKSPLGNIYRARVKSYIRAMDAYILDLGLDKDAILKKSRMLGSIKQGQDLLVEVLALGHDEKMYEVTQKFTISDGLLVVNPFVKSGKAQKVLRNWGYPVVRRSRSYELNETQLEERALLLIDKYRNIEKQINFLPSPKLIYEKDQIGDFIANYRGPIISNIKLGMGEEVDEDFNPKYDKFLSGELSKVTQRKINFFQDANIVIDRLEALTVIDINSANLYRELPKEEMAYRVNSLALEEICAAIRVREMKKMLLIDFIRMDEAGKILLEENFKNLLDKYRISYKIFGFSNMGLYELIIY
ncbi:ribonuclease E/G [Peptoniphilaceae bacterium SGI.131]